MTIRVERYTEQHKAAWDAFVAQSKNGTFLFLRDYMDYHRDRFIDHSLIAYEADRVISLLPANICGTSLVSHEGLSYGGFISDERMKLRLMLRLFDATLTYCREQGLTELRYMANPFIFHRLPAQEDLYALFLCGAQVVERRAMSVINSHERIPLPKGRRYSLNKARKYELRVCRADDRLPAFWELLEEILQERHHAHPAHTLAEIESLQRRFPQNIQLYTCFENSMLIAGVLIFETGCVARTQYIAVNARGRELSALDLIIKYLLNEVFAEKPYFDFGTSQNPQTHVLNAGLIDQKEGFGGRTVTQDTYRLDLTNWNRKALHEALT